jgi:hypothetical protein
VRTEKTVVADRDSPLGRELGTAVLIVETAWEVATVVEFEGIVETTAEVLLSEVELEESDDVVEVEDCGDAVELAALVEDGAAAGAAAAADEEEPLFKLNESSWRFSRSVS